MGLDGNSHESQHRILRHRLRIVIFPSKPQLGTHVWQKKRDINQQMACSIGAIRARHGGPALWEQGTRRLPHMVGWQ